MSSFFGKLKSQVCNEAALLATSALARSLHPTVIALRPFAIQLLTALYPRMHPVQQWAPPRPRRTRMRLSQPL